MKMLDRMKPLAGQPARRMQGCGTGRLLAPALALALACPLVAFAAQPQAAGRSQGDIAAHDPYATVYVVTSRETHARAARLLGTAQPRVDAVGTPLVIATARAHQLGELSAFVHRSENRCGGFFAFDTRAEAEAFVRNDRSARALAQPLAASYTIDNQATVDPWIPQASEQNIYDTIEHLSGYLNRYYASSTGQSSAEWIRDTWQSLAAGRGDASTELFSCGSCSTQPSVILTVQGSELPDEVVVLGAHLDSINGGGGGESQVAPGADDDASGIATLTEVIRVALASGWQPRRTVKFMGYAAEEVGLRGSNAIAQSFADAGTNVVGVLQLDMTNYADGGSADMRLVTDYSNADLKTFFNQLFDEYLVPLGHTRGSYTCGYGCSDHASWTSAGYPSAMFFEAGTASGGYNPYIHSEDDTLQNSGGSAAASVKFAQFGLAFLGELAKTAGSGGGDDGDDGADGSVLVNGEARTGLSAGAGESLEFTLDVPVGAGPLTFATSGGSGDADLYVRFGAAATDSSYDCRPYKSGNAETCSFDSPQAGTYHVRLKAYSAFSGLRLVGEY